jgi:lytic cellulose monooxygenase (C1-hydroxylating)
MKITGVLSLLTLLSPISAHTIFQRLKVNGADQGQLVGVRAPSSNNPVQDVSGSSIACNTGLYSPVSSAVVTIPAGATVSSWWEHLIGGPQGSSDPDNPIAASHKGPVMVYLAEVSNAGTASTSGLNWFKIYQDGVDSSGKWGVDRMIAGNGWYDFTVPSCVKPGQYLMRVEIIALHSAYTQGQAQFYVSNSSFPLLLSRIQLRG